MNIVFVEPALPNNQRRFVAALASVGPSVIGGGDSSECALGDELRGQMSAYYHAPLARSCWWATPTGGSSSPTWLPAAVT